MPKESYHYNVYNVGEAVAETIHVQAYSSAPSMLLEKCVPSFYSTTVREANGQTNIGSYMMYVPTKTAMSHLQRRISSVSNNVTA